MTGIKVIDGTPTEISKFIREKEKSQNHYFSMGKDLEENHSQDFNKRKLSKNAPCLDGAFNQAIEKEHQQIFQDGFRVGMQEQEIIDEKALTSQKQKFDDLQKQFEHLYNLKEEQKQKFLEVVNKTKFECPEGHGECQKMRDIKEELLRKLEGEE